MVRRRIVASGAWPLGLLCVCFAWTTVYTRPSSTITETTRTAETPRFMRRLWSMVVDGLAFETNMLFTAGYLWTAYQFGIKKGSEPIKDWADLKGKSVSVNKGTPHETLSKAKGA